MFSVDGNKASGPDGFSSYFFKKACSTMGDDVCKAVRDFFKNGKILKEINSTLITLVLKIQTPIRVTDFRPIACLNQSAFVPNRHIQDNILLLQELLKRYDRKEGPKRIAMKIDIQKAYDTVNWFGYFKGGRGLRQGDPMSPYLFIMVMEILSLIVEKKNKVLNWKNKCLSCAGRLQLITSVLESIHVYGFFVFLLPQTVIDDINKVLKGFLCNQDELAKGKSKVAWESVCNPKSQGGLGLKDLGVWNKAMIAKHLWHLAINKDSLWVKWVNVVKLKGKSIWFVCKEASDSWGWRNILRIRDEVRQFLVKKIGDGGSTLVLWKDDIVVKDIVVNGVCKWPVLWLDKYPQLANQEQFWKFAMSRMGVQIGQMDWNMIISHMSSLYCGNSIDSVIRRVGFSACVYLIWQERNCRIFKDEKRIIKELTDVFTEIVRMRILSLKTFSEWFLISWSFLGMTVLTCSPSHYSLALGGSCLRCWISESESLWARSIKAIHGSNIQCPSPLRKRYNSCWKSILHEVNSLSKRGIQVLKYLQIKLGDGKNLPNFWSIVGARKESQRKKFQLFLRLELCKIMNVADKGVSKLILSRLLEENPQEEALNKISSNRLIVFYRRLTFMGRVSNNSRLQGLNISRRGMLIDSIDCPKLRCGSGNYGHSFFFHVRMMASGLKVNINKNSLFGIGVEMEEVEGWATSPRCRPGSLPFYYLGLPVGYNMGRIENWNTLVQKFKNKLAIWKTRLISFGGRLTLLWDGGLNIGSLKAMNWALLAKWWWRFHLERDAFWVKVIRSLYGEGGGTVGQSLSGSGYSVWCNIIKVGKDLDKIGIHLSLSFKWEPGSGDTIMFWEDNWIGVGRLRDLFPRLYHLDVVNDAILSKKGYWREDEWVWNWVWRRSDHRGRAVTDVHNLSDLVQDFRLKKDTKDKCKWRLNDSGSFTVKGLRDLVDSKILEPTWSIFETSWRIPARIVPDNLGIDLHSVLCPCCEESSESLDHCFVTCPEVKPIWDRVFEWWGAGMQNLLSVEDVRNIVDANAFTGLKKEIWKGIVWSVSYFIWMTRNQVVFKRNGSRIPDLFKEAQGRVFKWIAIRLKKSSLKWEDWTSGLIVRSISKKNLDVQGSSLWETFGARIVPVRRPLGKTFDARYRPAGDEYL
ncbi:hypothetical protein Tco_0593958 [Tanacetum coccineum]